MVLLDQTDHRRFKLKPEKKAYRCTHSWKHLSNLIKIPWRFNVSTKKANNGGSYNNVHAIRHLKRNCSEEGHTFVKDSLKAVELKEKNHKEEVTEIVENIRLRKELKLLLRRGKAVE